MDLITNSSVVIVTVVVTTSVVHVVVIVVGAGTSLSVSGIVLREKGLHVTVAMLIAVVVMMIYKRS
jgi:hypothetical protein